jgi:hypothetical protein
MVMRIAQNKVGLSISSTTLIKHEKKEMSWIWIKLRKETGSKQTKTALKKGKIDEIPRFKDMDVIGFQPLHKKRTNGRAWGGREGMGSGGGCVMPKIWSGWATV